MSRVSVVLKFFLSQTAMLLQNAAKGWNSLGGHYNNVYEKISFAPINILASVLAFFN